MTPIPITTRLPTDRDMHRRNCWWGHQVGDTWRWRWRWKPVGPDTHWLPAGEVGLPSRVAPVTERYACVPVADRLASVSGGNEPV